LIGEAAFEATDTGFGLVIRSLAVAGIRKVTLRGYFINLYQVFEWLVIEPRSALAGKSCGTANRIFLAESLPVGRAGTLPVRDAPVTCARGTRSGKAANCKLYLFARGACCRSVGRRHARSDIFRPELPDILDLISQTDSKQPPDQSSFGRICTTCWISPSGTSSQTSSDGSNASTRP
jgi:hypothetical protein